jgi:hypothetical protein
MNKDSILRSRTMKLWGKLGHRDVLIGKFLILGDDKSIEDFCEQVKETLPYKPRYPFVNKITRKGIV